MIYSKIPLAQTLVQLSKSYGFQNVVISPGSRNAPLIIGFSEDNFFDCYSIVDERCAAFFGLGMAQSTKWPTILVCTSGSAVLNYYPAVAEAFYSNIPLVVISADRPEHLLDIGDGQTINQENVLGNHVFFSGRLKLDISAEKAAKNDEELPIIKSLGNTLERFLNIQNSIQEYNEEQIILAFETALKKSGPVHLNAPFNEPLYETSSELAISLKPTKSASSTAAIADEVVNKMAAQWSQAAKKMIVVGVLDPNELDQRFIEDLAKDKSVVVFTETTSNLHSDYFFPSIDKIIAPLNAQEFEQLQPDILMTFGGMVVSKKIKAFLRKYPPKEHWHVGEHGAMDTYFKLSQHVHLSPNKFLTRFLAKIKIGNGDYRPMWYLVKQKRVLLHREYLKKIDFSDFKAFQIIFEMISQPVNLQLSNSATIRYSQLFDLPNDVYVYCNRGTSGIDGSTSTAIGFAVKSKIPTVLISGDLSFFYDSNALWNDHIPNNFRLIIINNQGGGIFRILPGKKDSSSFEKYFETTHDLNCSSLCKMFNLEYLEAKDENELRDQLKDFYGNSDRPKLLEIFTPREKNDEILINYFEYIK